MRNNPRGIFTLACLISLALFQSCDDSLTELEKLPPATQSGNRTFGCLVDGKAWVIEGITNVSADYQTGTLFIHAGLNDKNFNSLIQLHIYDLTLSETSYYLVERSTQPESNDARYYDHDTSCEFFTTNSYAGIVTITHFDNINYIISGTFEFDAYSADCSKVIKITHGRFDIVYAP